MLACGQAGERLCRIACVQTETGNAAGQGGFGAVMGSKNLKAIAVCGTEGVRVAHPDRLLDLALTASRESMGASRPGEAPARRQRPQLEGLSRLKKCGFCLGRCGGQQVMNVPGETTHGMHSTYLFCFGYMTTPRGNVESRTMTSDYGVNGWEIAYGIIPWLQMCKQQGLIDAIDGLPIPVPEKEIHFLHDTANVSPEFMAHMVRTIALREGEMGDALADGACYAAERLFGGAGAPLLDRIYPRRFGQTNHWNGHWGTGGRPYFPFWLVPVLQFCVDTRDPASDSTHAYANHVLSYLPEHGPHRGPLTVEQARAICERIYGEPDVYNPAYTYDKPETKVIPAIMHHDWGMLLESLTLCDYEQPRIFSMESEDRAADTEIMAKLFSACTGQETDFATLTEAGSRIFNLLRAVDVRNHDRSRAVDWYAAQTMTEPAFSDGVVLDLERFASHAGPLLRAARLESQQRVSDPRTPGGAGDGRCGRRAGAHRAAGIGHTEEVSVEKYTHVALHKWLELDQAAQVLDKCLAELGGIERYITARADGAHQAEHRRQWSCQFRGHDACRAGGSADRASAPLLSGEDHRRRRNPGVRPCHR